MTLERQTISVPIGVGQSSHEAAPYVEGNAEARNVRFEKVGQADKRLPRTTVGGSPSSGFGNVQIEDVRGLAASFGAMGASSYYDPTLDDWSVRNDSAPRMSDAVVSSIMRGRRMTVLPSMAIVGSTMCVVWCELDDGSFVTSLGTGPEPHAHMVAFFDVGGDAPALLSGPTPSGFTRSAHVVGLNTDDADACFIFIGETGAASMGWARYTLAAGTYTVGSITALTSRIANDVGFDACGPHRQFAAFGGVPRAYAVWESASGTTVVSIGATGSATTRTISTAGMGEGIACMHDPEIDRLWIGQLDGAVYSVPYTDITLGPTSHGTVTWPAGLSVTRVTFMGKSGGTAFCGSDRKRSLVSLSAPTAWGTWVHRMSDTGAPGAGFLLRNLQIAGKGTAQGFSTYYGLLGLLPVIGGASRRIFVVAMPELSVASATLEPSYATTIAAVSETAWCESNVGDTSLYEQSWTIPSATDEDGRAFVVYPSITSLYLPLVGYEYPLASPDGIGLDCARINHLFGPPRRSAHVADVTLVAGGAGVSCADAILDVPITPQRPDPPHLTDEVVSDVVFAPVGGTDTYYVSVGWGWIDAAGREHRGPISYTTANLAGSSINDMTNSVAHESPRLWVAPYPAHDAHLESGARDLFLDVYLSMPDDPTVRRRVRRIINPDDAASFPDCKAFFFSFASSTPSATYPNGLVQFQSDVTSTGFLPAPYSDSELEAVAPGAMLSITSSQSRLWGISAESRFSVQVTKPLTSGYAPEFATELAIDVPAEGGACVGLASVDDKIVVFKRDRIFVIYGEPGDANGENSTLQLPRLVSSDVGCIFEPSIVEGPFGVAFQSARGVIVLGRDLSLTPIGERVEDVTEGKLLAGTLVPRSSEVRWTIGARVVQGSEAPYTIYPWVSTGERLAWSYAIDQWSIWDDTASGETVRAGVPWAIDGGAGVYESEEWSAATHLPRIVSPWVRVSGVEGYQRVWRVVALLYHYTGDVRISLAYDYDDDDAQTVDFAQATCESARAANGRLELSVRPARQKCSAIRVTIEEIGAGQYPPYPDQGEGISIVSIDLEVGVKSGTSRRRLSSSQKG